MLRNFKIGQRLGLGFAAVLLLLLAVLLLGLRQMSSVQDKLEQMTRVTLHKTEVLSNLGSAIDLRAIAARNLTLLTEPAAQQAELDRIAQAKKALDAALKDLGETLAADPGASEAEHQQLAKLRALETRYEPIAAGVVARATAGKPAEAVALLTQDCMPLLVDVLKNVEAFSQMNRERANAESAAAQAGYEQARWVMLGLGLVALVSGMVVAVVLTRSVAQPLQQVAASTRTIAAGDLTQTIHVQGSDEVSDVQRALSDMQGALARLIAEVSRSTDGISTASTQIATGNLDLSSRTEQTASNLQETASSMEQLTGTVKQTADSARTANQLASSAATAAQRGGSVVTQVVANMEDISAASRKIADIIGVIDGIAFQTNILALNAAVEAARAGEQGRGFAVVAGEVRNLAQRSAQAAKEIKDLIGDSVDKVESGARLVQDAGSSMQEIVSSVQRVSDIIGEITAAAAEQSDGIGQINMAVTNLDQMTQQNAALVEESSAAAESLRDQAQRLQQAIGSFRLEQTAQLQASAVIARARSTPAARPAPAAKGPAKAATGTRPAAARPAASRPAAPASVPTLATPATPPAAPAGDDDWTSF